MSGPTRQPGGVGHTGFAVRKGLLASSQFMRSNGPVQVAHPDTDVLGAPAALSVLAR